MAGYNTEAFITDHDSGFISTIAGMVIGALILALIGGGVYWLWIAWNGLKQPVGFVGAAAAMAGACWLGALVLLLIYYLQKLLRESRRQTYVQEYQAGYLLLLQQRGQGQGQGQAQQPQAAGKRSIWDDPLK